LPNGEPSTPGSLLDGLRGDSPKFELLHTTPYYYNNQYPRTNLYSAMPFGLFRSQIIRWLNEDFNKNGLKYIFAKDNDSTIITYPGGFTGAQYGGWFKYDSSKQFYDAMNSDNLYRNQKGRYPGLAGVVLNKKYGAEFPSRSAPSEIISDALEKGYSFFEFVGPSMDMQLGLHRVKGFNVYCLSSWHEPCTMLTLSVNNNRLQELFALNPQIESIFNGILQRYFLGQNTDEIYDKTTNDNGRALNEFHNQEIDTVHLSLPYLDSLRKDSDKYLNEWLTSTLDINKKVDASTKKLFESYMKLWNPTDYYINAFSHPDFK
jgi:TRAP-type mannitol/chloroaromatic compound transport system substrate-binding protein